MQNKQTHFEVSAYSGAITPEGFVVVTKKLLSSFPDLDSMFYDILLERAKELNFSDRRLLSAVNHVIDTCVYPRPKIAEFISYDKKIKLFNYAQMLKLNDEFNGKAFKYYSSVKIEGINGPLWAKNEEVRLYNLTPFKNEK